MDSAVKIWQDMLSLLEREASTISFDVWIKPLEPVGLEDDRLVLLAPTEANREAVNASLRPLIKNVLTSVNPLYADITMVLPEDLARYPEALENAAEEEESKPEVKPAFDAMVINPRYSFDNFVVGECNRFAHAAARAVSEQPGTTYNPLFIYGAAGLGKTHIMHAIGNHIRRHNKSLKVLYVSSEKFVNELISSIRGKAGTVDFREKYRSVDVLMIDDIQFISKKESTQTEMFHTFNDLYQENKQLIFASDRPPKEIPDLEDRLRSRFEWGLIADIQPPDLETRIAILQKKAQLEKYVVPDEVLLYMAQRIDSNIREMESLLNKIILLSKLYERPADIDLAAEAFRDYQQPTEEAIGAEDIIVNTCRYFNVKREDILGKKRDKDIVEPRQICIYLISELLPLPLSAIGTLIGGRDHTTIMHAKNKIAAALKNDEPRYKKAINDIKNLIYKV